MRATPSFTSRTEPTSSTSREVRSAASISRRRMSLISPGRRDVGEAIGVIRVRAIRANQQGSARFPRTDTAVLVKNVTRCRLLQRQLQPHFTTETQSSTEGHGDFLW